MTTSPSASAATNPPILLLPRDTDTDLCDAVLDRWAVSGDTLQLHLRGEIDLHTAEPLRALLARAAACGFTDLVVDLSGVSFADSAFLDLLDGWAGPGRRYRLTGESRTVDHLLLAAVRAGCPPPAPRGPGAPPARGGPRGAGR
ncbi:STAS domain-containing protein [Streptomyces sp. BI20]|uniref:STAS domain-containing protein n=1 Tax=Streptomyces sp. BI20 TaxID=3403460 RepID=UPI003C775D3D